MRPSTRSILAATLAAGLVAAVLPPAASAFDAAGQKCRSTIAKGGLKNTKAYMKAMTGCFKVRDASPSSTDCNDITAADTAAKVPGTEQKFAGGIAKSCTTGVPADLLFFECPAPCDVGTPTIATFADVAECLTCLGRDSAQALGNEAFGLPTSPLADAADLACHSAITKNVSKFYNTILKNVAKCQTTAEKAGGSTVENCTETTFSALIWDAYVKTRDGVADKCEDVTFPSAALDTCGGAASVDALAACVAESAWDEGQAIITQYFSLPAAVVTTTTTTTTLPSAAGCPDRGELVLYSKLSNISCTDNADCTEPRTCDTTLGLCTTVARLDTGWTGLSHGADINDGVRTRAALHCPNAAAPTCGECNVTGIDPEPRNCRCANDTRQVCGDPFAAVSDDCPSCSGGPFAGLACTDDTECTAVGTCGRRCSNDVNALCTSDTDCPGGTCPAQTKCADGDSWANSRSCDGTCSGTCTATSACDCYFGAPFPLNSGGTPVCVVNRFAQNISGTADIDLGAGQISASLRARVYLGESNAAPCPVCDGDAVQGDGIRDGTCSGGENDDLPCDATATNASSPAEFGAPGGGSYSMDCVPTNGSNVSGQGLKVVLDQTTGSTQLDANVDCDGAGAGTALCPCLVCSKDSSVPCNANADCAGQGTHCSLDANIGCSVNTDCSSISKGLCRTSSCSAKGSGVVAEPNDCFGSAACVDLGGGQGECPSSINPDPPFNERNDTYFCSGLVKADGGGILACNTNADCTFSSVGGEGGTCTVAERKKCFLDPIVATGSPDPEFPVAVATFCVPPTSNSSINLVAGLPGPGRVVSQGAGTTFCASDRNVEYQPGIGGCPP
jgi:hypothetical protein